MNGIRPAAASARAMNPRQSDDNTSYAGVGELFAIEECLPAYTRDIVGKFAAHFPRQADVLDFGAGIGTLATAYFALTGDRPECLEIDPALRQILGERGFSCHASLQALTGSYDGIYSSNVLEHIRDDRQALRDLRAKLRPGGVLALYVPAHAILYNGIDASLGHFRRYGRKDLVGKLEDAGYAIVSWQFADCVGTIPWAAIKIMGRRKDGGLASARSLRFYDRFVFPVSRLLDRLVMRRMFGKNILVIARNIAGTPSSGIVSGPSGT